MAQSNGTQFLTWISKWLLFHKEIMHETCLCPVLFNTILILCRILTLESWSVNPSENNHVYRYVGIQFLAVTFFKETKWMYYLKIISVLTYFYNYSLHVGYTKWMNAKQTSPFLDFQFLSLRFSGYALDDEQCQMLFIVELNRITHSQAEHSAAL